MGEVIKHVNTLPMLTGGQHLDGKSRWKSQVITCLLKSSLDATAFTCAIFCLSMHEKNGREGFVSMEMAKDFANMRGKITRPEAFNIYKRIAKTEKDLKCHKGSLE